VVKLRLGAQSVTLLSNLRDPTQLRRRQRATRQQHPFSCCTLSSSLEHLILVHLIMNEKDILYLIIQKSIPPASNQLKFLLLIRKKEYIGQKKFPSSQKKCLKGFSGFRVYFFVVDHPLCDV
jgi:hypothetical protein